MILARITANAADFLALIDQHKQWREPFHFNETPDLAAKDDRY